MSGCGQVPREAACVVAAWTGAQAGGLGLGVHLEWGSPTGLLGWETEPREWPLRRRNLTSESVCGRTCEAHIHWEGGGTSLRALPSTGHRAPGV